MFQCLSSAGSSAIRRACTSSVAPTTSWLRAGLAVPGPGPFMTQVREFRKRPMVKHTKQKKKPKYRPTPPPEPLAVGHPRHIGEDAVITIVPHSDKEVFSFNAISRTKRETRKYFTGPLREKREYITGIINTKGIPSEVNRETAIRVLIPMREWEAAVNEIRHMNSVFDVYVDGALTPIQCITSHYAWCNLEETPLNVILLRYEEGQKYAIHMPVQYENYEDAEALRKGGHFKEFTPPEGWKMWWKGSREIPRAISIDLLNTKVGYNYKLLEEHLVEGLTVRQPLRTEPGRQHYVLSSIKGKIKRGEDMDD